MLAEIGRWAGRLRLMNQPWKNVLRNNGPVVIAKVEIRFERDAEKWAVKMPMTQCIRIAVDDRGGVPVSIVNVVAVTMRMVAVCIVMMARLVCITAMMMVMIIVVMMNVGMVPAVMPMPSHGCEILLPQRALVHETHRVVQIDNSRIGAKSLRDQCRGSVAQSHAFRGLPSN